MSPVRFAPFRRLCAALAILLSFTAAVRAQTGGAGVLQFANAESFTIVNGIGTFTIPISRVGGSAGAITVSYATIDGTALAGRDYTAASGTLSWADGDSADKIVEVFEINQPLFEGERLLTFALSNPTGGAALASISSIPLAVFNTAIIAPSIVISSPPAGVPITSGDTVSLAAGVTDPSGILAKVQFYLDDQLFGETTGAGPYTFATTAPAAGTYVLKAVAIDDQGQQDITTENVTVIAADPANPPPSTSIITDLDGRALAAGSKVTVSASGLDSNGEPLAELDFYADGVLFGSFKPAADAARHPILRGRQPVTRDAGSGLASGSVFYAKFTMPGVSKLVSMITVALTKAGQAHVSAPVTVQAAVTADHAPHVALSGIQNGARVAVGATINVPVIATDSDSGGGNVAGRRPIRRDFVVSGVIARMEYYLNALKVKDSKSAPYEYDFSPPSAGTYVLSAIATDGGGLSTVSKPVTVEASSSTVVSISTVHGGTAEAGQPGKVLFARSGPDTSNPLTVAYQAKGTAVYGVNYQTTDGQPLSGSFVIPAGSSQKKLKVNLLPGATTKLKIQLLPSPDGSYELGSITSGKILTAVAP